MHQLLNSIINLLKWPIAVISVILFFPVINGLWDVLAYIFNHASYYSPLLYGAIVYFILWELWLKRSVMMNWFSTLDHELTHAVFAVLSLNRVTGLNATGYAGGATHYQGYRNWIITLSPYFVPLLSLIILLIFSLAKPSYYPVLSFMMGGSIAFHLQSTWRAAHRSQPDLERSGWIFVWLFLPTANLLMLLLLLTALPNDALSAERSLGYLWNDLSLWWDSLQ